VNVVLSAASVRRTAVRKSEEWRDEMRLELTRPIVSAWRKHNPHTQDLGETTRMDGRTLEGRHGDCALLSFLICWFCFCLSGLLRIFCSAAFQATSLLCQYLIQCSPCSSPFLLVRLFVTHVFPWHGSLSWSSESSSPRSCTASSVRRTCVCLDITLCPNIFMCFV